METELKFEAKRDGTTPQLSVDGGILNLVHINRDKAGSYRVKADNDAGQTSIDFTIDVQCKAMKYFVDYTHMLFADLLSINL